MRLVQERAELRLQAEQQFAEELAELALKNGIQPLEACTLVLLTTG